jgi:hypothetical protein
MILSEGIEPSNVPEVTQFDTFLENEDKIEQLINLQFNLHYFTMQLYYMLDWRKSINYRFKEITNPLPNK